MLDEETMKAVSLEVEVSWLLSESCPRPLIVRWMQVAVGEGPHNVVAGVMGFP